MSVILLSDYKIMQLAAYIADLSIRGCENYGFSIPEDLANELSDCRDYYGDLDAYKVYRKLFELNAAAYVGRYKEEETPEPLPKAPEYKPIHHMIERIHDEAARRWYDKIEPWHYELLKLTQCFNYQCDSDATYQTPLFKALKKLEAAEMTEIVTNNPDYVRAAWAF